MCHSWKNGSHLKKCVAVGKIGHTYKMCHTWKMGHM